VDAGSESNDGRFTQQIEGSASYEIGVTGTESNDSNDGLHL
jgi:hypothetical protein